MDAHENFTIGIICPLGKELHAVIASFDGGYTAERDEGRNTTYYHGKLADKDVVAVCLPEGHDGLTTTVTYAERLQQRYPCLRIRFLTGIAGGVPGGEIDVRLGDVVVATQTVNYRKGRLERNNNLCCTAHRRNAPKQLLDHLSDPILDAQLNGEHLAEILRGMRAKSQDAHANQDENHRWSRPSTEYDLLFKHDYNHADAEAKNCQDCERDNLFIRSSRARALPQVHKGLIASGDVVLKDGCTRNKLKDDFNGVIAVDMEASALNEHGYIVVRGICDYADTHKNDIWQNYAAAVAAACTRVLALSLSSRDSSVPRLSRLSQIPIPPEIPAVPRNHVGITWSPVSSETALTTGRVRPFPLNGPAQTVEVCSCFLSSVGIKKRNADGVGRHIEAALGESEVTLWRCGGPEFQQMYWRLQIAPATSNQDETTYLWLPLADILVKLTGTLLTLQFSDCNQLGWMNEYGTLQGRNQYTPIYNSEHPNVEVRLLFSDEDAAKGFSEKLLDLRNAFRVDLNPIQQLGASDSQIVWLYELESSSFEPFVPLLLAIMQEHEFEGLKYHRLVLRYIKDHFNFELRANSNPEQTEVSIHHCHEIIYHATPYVSAYWPPDMVLKNVEGCPTRIELGCKSGSHTLSLTLPSDGGYDRTRFMNNLVPGEWRLLRPGFTVQFRSFSRSRFRNPVQGYETCELMIWRLGPQGLILLRTTRSSNSQWLSSALTTGGIQVLSSSDTGSLPCNSPTLRVNSVKCIITLSNARHCRGDFLLRRNTGLQVATFERSRNMDSRKEATVVNWAQLEQEYKFHNPESMQVFRTLLEPFLFYRGPIRGRRANSADVAAIERLQQTPRNNSMP
ncbi:hypothetical protein LTR84_010460 [Exophiala bonariae]|uniref:Nucleoside phosphorylase domain-containing protein n=1 Tax=Exophiala bonariae TaxID=1690606 RepID=A0AAV9MTR4_9EURO|nr:hypothetical protein LTR84_010460 [Exophiala bonariae]